VTIVQSAYVVVVGT